MYAVKTSNLKMSSNKEIWHGIIDPMSDRRGFTYVQPKKPTSQTSLHYRHGIPPLNQSQKVHMCGGGIHDSVGKRASNDRNMGAAARMQMPEARYQRVIQDSRAVSLYQTFQKKEFNQPEILERMATTQRGGSEWGGV